jgi:Ca-activated chloride channel family protein
MRKPALLTLSLSLLLILLSVTPCLSANGVVRGVVTDSAGGVIPGATVSIVNEATGAERTVTSGDDGGYAFAGLPPGTYSIWVTVAGFKTFSRGGIRLASGATVRIDVRLEVSAMEETISIGPAAVPPRAMAPAKMMGYLPQQLVYPPFNTEAYDRIDETGFRDPRKHPLSTFSIDVDTASYANTRRFIKQGALPPKDAVRIEELINYFSYDYEQPKSAVPFSVTSELGACPWKKNNKLLLIGLQGRAIDMSQRPPANLVFLIDVSGSMQSPDKLPLLKSGLKLLAKHLTEQDHLTMVVYAGASGVVLPRTTGADKEKILTALEGLEAGGSTHGSAGIQLAYEQAKQGFIEGGVNRVILATDGDFNVGVTDIGALTRLIEEKRETGVYLSVLGFGQGNLKDATMEKLADRGNGNYSYIDSLLEARKVLVAQAAGTLITIAKDVKIQVEFNPARVEAYRLIGYENRMLRDEDFKDDRKDAGEIGAGHTVTALYEIVPHGQRADVPDVDDLKYQKEGKLSKAAASDELATVKLRYKPPEANESQPLSITVKDETTSGPLSPNLGFAAAVAEFGMVLRDSEHKGSASLAQVLELARKYRGEDREAYRSEFIHLVELAKELR